MKRMMRSGAVLAIGCGLIVILVRSGAAKPADAHTAPMPGPAASSAVKPLPPLPESLPRWMNNQQLDKIFYKRGRYNFDIYNIQPLAYDLNAVAVGHAM